MRSARRSAEERLDRAAYRTGRRGALPGPGAAQSGRRAAAPERQARQFNADTKTPSRRAVKARQMEALRATQVKVADTISRLADRVGDVAVALARK